MQALAIARGRALGYRLALGIVVFVLGLMMVGPVLATIWAALMPISQFIDHHLYRRFRDTNDNRPVTRSELIVCGVSTSLSAAIYTSLPAIAYFAPMPEAKIFALLWLCGASLNVMVQQSPVRSIFLAGMSPLLGALILLPLISLIQPGALATDAAVFIMAMSFAVHLLIGFNFYHSANAKLVAARDEAIERGRAAEKASKSKSRFLALMSHELRTPMNGVLGAGHLLRRTKLTDRQKELVDALEDAGEVLMVILNDILDLAKLDAARTSLHPAPTDIDALTSSLANLWRSRAEEKGLILHVDVDIEAGADWAAIDAVRVRQIVGNLLSNAIKFTDDGSVTLHVRTRGQDDSVKLDFAVSDTGCGIAPETLPNLFQPFSQADDSASRQHGGTGLGLLICRQLAELMGGSVDAESQVGEGSRFSFAFEAPSAGRVAKRNEKSDAGGGDLAPLTILVAEDNAINRLVVAGLLEPGGHDLSFAENGAEALEMAATQTFDMILMDLHMPEMDGLDAAQRIRADNGPNAESFICGLSADAAQENISEALGRGMNAYLTKPISPAELDKVIARARVYSTEKAERGRRSAVA